MLDVQGLELGAHVPAQVSALCVASVIVFSYHARVCRAGDAGVREHPRIFGAALRRSQPTSMLVCIGHRRAYQARFTSVSNAAPKHRKSQSRDFGNFNLEDSCLSRRPVPDYELVTCRKAAACSPMTTQGAMVLPVVTRGRMEASAIRSVLPIVRFGLRSRGIKLAGWTAGSG